MVSRDGRAADARDATAARQHLAATGASGSHRPGRKGGRFSRQEDGLSDRRTVLQHLVSDAFRQPPPATALECLTRFLQGFYTPPELEGRARRVLEKAALSGGEATYALALAEAISQRGLAHDLRTHTELLILRQTEGIQEQIARIIDPTELSPQAIDFHEQRRKLRSLVPEDSPVSPDEFADLVLSSVSLVPPNPEFDRRSIAAAEQLSRASRSRG